MSRALALLLLVSAGCRFGFDENPIVVLDAHTADDTPDAAITTITFGERTGSMTTGVTIDTVMFEADPSSTFGLIEDFSIDGGIGTRSRAALRFDVSSIASGTQVIGARLSLVVIDYGDEMTGDVALFTPAQAWTEPYASWDDRDMGIKWTTAGGAIGTPPVVTFTPGPTEALITVPAALVQSWVDSAGSNTGWVIVCGDEAIDTHYHFHSRESVQAANRPLLSIDVVR